MKTQRTVIPNEVEFSNDGNVYINGELYGTEQEYYQDIDDGKIYVADSKRTKEGWKYFDENMNVVKEVKF